VDRTYTATQYALLASIGTAGRTTLASSSGALVDWLNGDWGVFFILTAIMVIPSLICLWFIKDKLKLKEEIRERAIKRPWWHYILFIIVGIMCFIAGIYIVRFIII